MPVTVSKSGPGLAQLAARLKQISKSEVLVGVPAEHALRKEDKMNNATLLWIQSHGSEKMGIPARPVLEPSIEANKALIAPHLAAAAKAVLEKKPQQAEDELNRAGTIAANGAKRWFSKEHLLPNAPSTIAKKGSDTPLIDTAALRRSLTHVLRIDGQTQKPADSTDTEG